MVLVTFTSSTVTTTTPTSISNTSIAISSVNRRGFQCQTSPLCVGKEKGGD